MMRVALVLLATTLLSSCGGSAPTPAGPSTTTPPQIAGTYSGPTTDTTISPPVAVPTWAIKFTRGGTGAFFRSCSGTLVLEQSGSTLTGSFTQAADCAPPATRGPTSGLVNNGIVHADRRVTFSIAGPASDPLAWTGFDRCTMLVPGTMEFTGTVSGGLLDASFVRDAVIECPGEGAVWVNVRLRGTR